jgi:hypothetical protein
MFMPTFFTELLRQFGFSATALVAIALALRPFLKQWLTKRIDAEVEEGLRQRLAAHQLSLDKEMEGFRKQLERESDRARALLNKEAVDYSIYAQRRHDAIARLFDELLHAEVRATSFGEYNVPASKHLEQSRFTAYTFTLELIPEDKATVQRLYVEGQFDEVDHRMEAARKAIVRRRLEHARNEAYEAYYRAALYLPHAVDESAIAIRDHFHMMILPYAVKTLESGGEIIANKAKLRFLMLELQNKARADLSGSAPKLS